ncbi:MAG: GUN4 domain-containing protein [Trichodesmium sp. MO_231.B1]|nr:GUN4 domain-containing protein [Trichodesmium sp. MO_231.B1]
MAKNWAICVGINDYDNMPTLKYAQRDAELMRDYFLNEAGFEKVYLFTDNSPEINDAGKPFNSKPTYGTLKRFLRVRFNKKFLSAGDNFWFFYSGHGMRFKDRDYLMPADADPHPDGVEYTAISLYFVTERLRRCGADNVILFLDACRSQESSRGLGIGEEKQKGVITIFSCSPNEKSYEIEDKKIQQGSFTYALLESLRIKGEGNCATVERLYNRLRHQVPGINHQFGKSRQTPYAIVEPATKYHLILLEKQATEQDIATLREEALEAENESNLELAEQLWTRILAVSPANEKALKALRRIWQKPEPENVKLGTTNSSKSGKNHLSNDQGEKSTTKKAANKNPIKSTINTLKLKGNFVAGIIGVLGIGLFIIVADFYKSNKGSYNTPSLTTTNKVTNDKTSNINEEYSTLENFLKQKKWKEADEETVRLMLKVPGLEEKGYLTQQDIDNFSCTYLRRIDQLWVENSNNKFGFSVQKKIYHSLGGKKEYDSDIWHNFGDKVGWKKGDEWLSEDELMGELNSSSSHPKGHLPFKFIISVGRGRRVPSLSHKLLECNI